MVRSDVLFQRGPCDPWQRDVDRVRDFLLQATRRHKHGGVLPNWLFHTTTLARYITVWSLDNRRWTCFAIAAHTAVCLVVTSDLDARSQSGERSAAVQCRSAEHLRVLGSGVPMHAEGRGGPAYAVWVAGRPSIVVDMGGDSAAALSRAGAAAASVDAILISHLHADHLSGLSDFLWGEMTAGRRRHSDISPSLESITYSRSSTAITAIVISLPMSRDHLPTYQLALGTKHESGIICPACADSGCRYARCRRHTATVADPA